VKMSKCETCIKNDVCNYKSTFQKFEKEILSFEFVESCGEVGAVFTLKHEVANNHIGFDLRCKHFLEAISKRNYADGNCISTSGLQYENRVCTNAKTTNI